MSPLDTPTIESVRQPAAARQLHAFHLLRWKQDVEQQAEAIPKGGTQSSLSVDQARPSRPSRFHLERVQRVLQAGLTRDGRGGEKSGRI